MKNKHGGAKKLHLNRAGQPKPPSPPNEPGTGLLDDGSGGAPAPEAPAAPRSPLIDDGGIIGLDDKPKPAPAPTPAPELGGDSAAPAPAPIPEAPSMRMSSGRDFEEELLAGMDMGGGDELVSDGEGEAESQLAQVEIPADVTAQGANATADFLLNMTAIGANAVIVPMRAYNEAELEEKIRAARLAPKLREKIMAGVRVANQKNASPANEPFKPRYRTMLRGPLARWWAASGFQEIPPVIQLTVVVVVVGAMMYADMRAQQLKRDRDVQRILDTIASFQAEAGPTQTPPPAEEAPVSAS